MAPEVIAHSRGYGAAADWWSLGVLLSQCLTLSTPFRDPAGRTNKTFENIYTGRVTVPPSVHYRNNAEPHCVALLDALLTRDTGRRLCGEGLRLHPFFWGLDWAELRRRTPTPPHEWWASQRAREAEAAFESFLSEPSSSAAPAAAEVAPASEGGDAAAARWEMLVPGW
jgi:serine/threonine protein kinase